MCAIGGRLCSSDNCSTWQTNIVNLEASSRENILQYSAERSNIEQNQSSFQREFKVTWALLLALWRTGIPFFTTCRGIPSNRIGAGLPFYNWDLHLLGLISLCKVTEADEKGVVLIAFGQSWSAIYRSNYTWWHYWLAQESCKTRGENPWITWLLINLLALL